MEKKERQILDNVLKQIADIVDRREVIDMKLTYDIFTRKPCLRIGQARINDKGAFLKPKHIETFVGLTSVEFALDHISKLVAVKCAED